MMEPAEVQSIKSFLHIVRILAIIFAVILLLVGLAYIALVAYYYSVCSTFTGIDAYCGAAVVVAIAEAVWIAIGGIIAFLFYRSSKQIEEKVNARQYAAAKSQTLIWMILGFIFGIILGIILLVTYLKFDPVINWQRTQGQMPPPGYAPPPGTPYPQAAPAYAPPAPPMAAAAPPPPVAAAPPAAPICPKCGQPTTYIAQYGRYYCYTDQLYV